MGFNLWFTFGFTMGVPVEDKQHKIVLNAFMEIVHEFNRKPNELWVDQGREFNNKLMQEWLDNNDIFMYSTHNKGKSVSAERFKKTVNARIYIKRQLMIANLILVI